MSPINELALIVAAQSRLRDAAELMAAQLTSGHDDLEPSRIDAARHHAAEAHGLLGTFVRLSFPEEIDADERRRRESAAIIKCLSRIGKASTSQLARACMLRPDFRSALGAAAYNLQQLRDRGVVEHCGLVDDAVWCWRLRQGAQLPQDESDPQAGTLITHYDVRLRVEEIRSATSKPEWAHFKEDSLYSEVLQAIADGADDPRGLARIVLQTHDIDFRRMCS